MRTASETPIRRHLVCVGTPVKITETRMVHRVSTRPRLPEHISQVVLKVAQRCNLNCSYCYVYNRGDDSWRTRPTYLSPRVAHTLAQRIKEHCARHGDTSFTVELHGGEPLLLGRARMQRLVDVVRTGAAPVNIHFTLQTNGTLLDVDWLEFFARNRISFGLSLDGPPEIADRQRVTRSGDGSTQRVLDNVAALRAHGHLFDQVFGGCLCVVDPTQNGAELVDWFVEQGFTAFDFLLPDGNQANLPDGWTGVEPYTRFLLEAFDHWYTLSAPPRVRLFELMLLGLMGERPVLDGLGGDLRGLCVVESDGSIGAHDVMRMCGGVFSQDTLTVFENSFDDHAEAYRIDAIQQPSATCTSCPWFDACGGGYLPHRFDGASFDNPSLYCTALFALAERMHRALHDDLPSVVWADSQPIEMSG